MWPTLLALMAAAASAPSVGAGTGAPGAEPRPSAPPSSRLAPAPAPARPPRHLRDAGPFSELKAMLLKYVARCALDPGQSLAPPPGATGERAAASASFPGLVGLAPEWMSGKCGADCQERVSSCLLALVNRSGKHVQLSLTSASPSLVTKLVPSADDRAFPNQEGAFFGNVWAGQAFSCRGAQARKGPAVKRFCALEPASCASDMVPFVDAGACAEVCELRCFDIGGNDRRCAADTCRDPGGRVWRSPITTWLRNRVEAENADALRSTDATDGGLRPRTADARARFEDMDFGFDARADHTLLVAFTGAKLGARIEVWSGASRRLGAAIIPRTSDESQEVAIPLRAENLRGAQPIVLRLRGGRALGELTELELR